MFIALATPNQLSSFRSESSVKLHYAPKGAHGTF